MDLEYASFEEALKALIKDTAGCARTRRVFDWWVLQHVPACKGKNRKEATYYSMVGGLLNVLPNQMNAFLRLYDFAVYCCGWDSSLVEVVHEDSMYLYIDVDLNTRIPQGISGPVEEGLWCDRVRESVSLAVWGVANEIFQLEGKNTQGAVVLGAQMRQSPKSKEMVKIGMHIHFPSMAVTIKAARLVVAAIRIAFFSMEGTVGGTPCKDIAEAIDTEPYKLGGGLRLMGANKLLKCLTCSKRRSASKQEGGLPTRESKKAKWAEKQACVECGGDGYVATPRSSYHASLMIDDGEIRSDKGLLSDTYSNLVICTIFVGKAVPPLEAPPDLVLRNELKKEMRRGKSHVSTPKKRANPGDTAPAPKKAYDASMTKMQIDSGGALANKLSSYLCKEHKVPRNTPIYNIFALGNKYGWVIMVPTRSHWCIYKNGEHHSNHVWFKITSEGIIMRCYNSKCRDESDKMRRVAIPARLPAEFDPLIDAEIKKLEVLIKAQ